MDISYPGKMKHNKPELKHITLNLLRIREGGIFRSKT